MSDSPSTSSSEVQYVPDESEDNYAGEGVQVDQIPQSSSGLVLMLLKQIRIGMDLSRIVLPTFILEPRSMLEKLSDFVTHAELFEKACKTQDPLERFIGFVKAYLSGFYVRPKGVKKPYNPILGEFFRSQWKSTNSNTILVAEQVSHHPPISAFYLSNRKEGYIVNGSILFKTKFYGTSAGSLLDGHFTLYCLNFGEEYKITFPSAYVSGFLLGSLTMELSGMVSVSCKKSGYHAEIDFRSKPMFGGEYNSLVGKICKADRILYTLSGKWDGKIMLDPVDRRPSEQPLLLWQPTAETRAHKVVKQKPVFDQMESQESTKLWGKVSDAIEKNNQELATEEKAILEDQQRSEAKKRAESGEQWVPRFFEKNPEGIWTYKYFNDKLWDPETEIEEFELNGVIQSRKK